MKHEAWRHDLSAYAAPAGAASVASAVVARFADVDTRRHINNIAVYGLHHEARLRWLLAHGGAAVWPEGSLRLKPRHSRTEFWRECHYPAPIAHGVRLLGADSTGLTLASGLFQDGACAGIQQTLLAAWADDLATPQPLPMPWLAGLADQLQPAGELHPTQLPLGADARGHYRIENHFAARYADFDADGCTSEAAVMRGIEQARSTLLMAAYAAAGGEPERDWTNLLVARIDLHWAHHGAPPQRQPWALAGAVTHTGRSSAVLRVAMFQGATLHAMADCVMVCTDPAGPPGPQPLPPALRDALQALAWSGPAAAA